MKTGPAGPFLLPVAVLPLLLYYLSGAAVSSGLRGAGEAAGEGGAGEMKSISRD